MGGRVNGKGQTINSNSGVGLIPSGSKKMVQSLKEIVNCSEVEIYAMLKECNMDPNEAVNRLLSQDPFHEVKSKREKKKETKDATDSRSRGTSSTSSRGGRGSIPQFRPSDSSSRGKPVYKDNGSTAYTSSFGPGTMGNNANQQQPHFSDASGTMDKRALTMNAAEGISSAHPSTGFQSSWAGVPGQISMADIVKMGRSYGKPASNLNPSQQNADHYPSLVSSSAAATHDLHPSQNHAAKVSETNYDSGVVTSQHVPLDDDDWPIDEQPPAASVSSAVEPTVDSEPYNDSYDQEDQQFMSENDVQYAEDDDPDDSHANYVGQLPGSTSNLQEERSGVAPIFDNDLCQKMNSYQVQQEEAEDTGASISSVTTSLQQLTLPKDNDDAESEGGAPAVRIPQHLRVQSADCSHLSFGSFGSGTGASFSGPLSSRPVQSSPEETSEAVEEPSVGQPNTRNPEYYDDEHLTAASDENASHRMGAGARNYDLPSDSQPDVLKQEEAGVSEATDYPFPSSASNYTFENDQQLNPSLMHSQLSSQMQSLQSLAPSLSGYPSSASSTLLPSNVQSLREVESPYSPFAVAQSMPPKFSSTVSSISGPTISVTEAMKGGNFNNPQQPSQTPPAGGISGGAALPQHLLHPYSQPSLPLGHFTNMIGYPFLPQSYTYMPSAFQQAFAGNSSYHQSLGAVLPQYKNNVSLGSLPQSAGVASGYGNFGNSTGVPGNFALNPPTAPAGSSLGYDDVLSSQYKDGSHMLSLQQGPGARTMSTVPGSTYYSFQGQNQLGTGFRQGNHHQQQQQPPQQQPPSQHYGGLSGYPNFYHSQAGLSLELQQQILRDGSLSGSQVPQQHQQQPKQSQQIWQNTY